MEIRQLVPLYFRKFQRRKSNIFFWYKNSLFCNFPFTSSGDPLFNFLFLHQFSFSFKNWILKILCFMYPDSMSDSIFSFMFEDIALLFRKETYRLLIRFFLEIQVQYFIKQIFSMNACKFIHECMQIRRHNIVSNCLFWQWLWNLLNIYLFLEYNWNVSEAKFMPWTTPWTQPHTPLLCRQHDKLQPVSHHRQMNQSLTSHQLNGIKCHWANWFLVVT